MRGKVRLNAGAKKAIAGWQADAARVKAERQTDPNAFTTAEFAEWSDMTESLAYKLLVRREREGVYKRAKKIVAGKLRSAWTEVKA